MATTLQAERRAHRATRTLLDRRTSELKSLRQQHRAAELAAAELAEALWQTESEAAAELEELRAASLRGNAFAAEELRLATDRLSEFEALAEAEGRRADESERRCGLAEKELGMVNGKLAAAEAQIQILRISLEVLKQRDLVQRELLQCRQQLAAVASERDAANQRTTELQAAHRELEARVARTSRSPVAMSPVVEPVASPSGGRRRSLEARDELARVMRELRGIGCEPSTPEPEPSRLPASTPVRTGPTDQQAARSAEERKRVSDVIESARRRQAARLCGSQIETVSAATPRAIFA